MKTFSPLFILLISLFLFSCTEEKKERKNILNLALTSNISTLDPARSYDTVSAQVVYQIYESLYEYDYLLRPYQLKPLLAQGMPKIEKEGTKYTIKIKKNVYYHPSPAFKGKKRKLQSYDFVNQFKRIAFTGTQSSGWWLFEGKIKGLDQFRKKAKKDFSDFFSYKVEGLETPDAHTLIINLTRPYPQLLYALAMAFTTPVSRELIEFSKNDLNEVSIGTGPYYLDVWNKNHYARLKKNLDHHNLVYPRKGDRYANQNNLLNDAGDEIPFIAQVNFHIIKEAQTRWLNFLKGKIDLITLSKDHFPLALNPDGQLNQEFEKKNIKLQVAPTLTYWWLAFNMQDPILGKNLLLRKAIARAININKYIKDFTNNIALEANSIYPPGVKGYSPSFKLPYEYDLKKARELIKNAGYPNGKDLPEFSYDVRGASTVSRQMGEFIRNELSKIGIKINVITNSFPGFLNKARTGQLQIWQGGWAMDYPHPENVVQLLITKNHPPGPNSTYYSNKRIDSLYSELSQTDDEDKILEITKEVQKTITKELPWIMQFYSRNYILHHGHLKNFRQSDLITNNLKYLKIE